MKKILIIVLTLALSVTAINFGIFQHKNAYADEQQTTNEDGYLKKDDIYYTVNDGYVTIRDCEYNKDVVDIPEKIDGYVVKKINFEMSMFCSVKIINIPKTVIEIEGFGCFYGNTYHYIKTEEVNVDKNNQKYTSIDGVLYNKDITKMLIYPKSRKAKKYIEPSSVIGGYLYESRDYSGCKCLEEITFSSNKKTYNVGFMACCENLKTVNIPANIMNTNPGDVELGAFEYCTNLTKVNFTKNSHLKSISADSFSKCSKLKNIDIPKSVKWIGEAAFWGCTSLKKVTLHKNLKTIEYSAFRECKNLKTIKIPKGVKEVGKNSFEKCDNLKNVKLYKGLKNIKKYAFYKCKKLKKITIPKGVKKIEKYAFRKTKIKKVKIPKSVKKLSKEAFNKKCKIKRIK